MWIYVVSCVGILGGILNKLMSGAYIYTPEFNIETKKSWFSQNVTHVWCLLGGSSQFVGG